MIFDFIFSIAVGTIELIAILAIALLIQGIIYQLTGFSTYKWLICNLIDKQLQK